MLAMPEITMRTATASDIPALVAMLVDDELGASRETPDELVPYQAAFARVQAATNTQLMVAELDGEVVGTLTLTVLHGLSRQGASRANVEAVRVAKSLRSKGIGTQMMQWAVEEAKRQGCRRMQLTSDTRRLDAHRFYTRLGFDASHVGFTLTL